MTKNVKEISFKAMRIAVIGTKGLPPKQGGIERYCEELYVRIVAQGHSVDLFARSSYLEKPWFYSYSYKGIKIVCLPSLPFKGLDATLCSAFGALAATSQSYDVVHFHALGPALFSWLPRLFSSAKVIVTCQGLDWQRAKWGKLASKMIYWGERMAVKFSHAIVVVSEDLRAYFWKNYKIDTSYIPNGPAEYANSDSEFAYIKSLGLKPGRYMLFLGRLVPEKRPDLLIEAFKKIEHSDWKLLLAGGVSDTAGFADGLVKLAGNDRRISFAGEVQGAYLAEVVRGAGLFVLPSDLEGLPLVMLEAMREGIPVVASNIAPHRQLIEKERGLMFQAGDRQSLVAALQKAIKNPSLRERMAHKAQEYIKINYNWSKITDANLKLYKKLFSLDRNQQKDKSVSSSFRSLEEREKQTEAERVRDTSSCNDKSSSDLVNLANRNRVIPK
ncbi:MAG: glycosyltransferase family 4 protein [Xenococcaceae cyanobacterium]